MPWSHIAVTSALLLIAVAETALAVLMYTGLRSVPNFTFLLGTLSLLAASVVSARAPGSGASISVQSSAAAALLALFWAAGKDAGAGPSITLGHTTYQLTLTLAALLFAALLLGRLLSGKPTEQACKCG